MVEGPPLNLQQKRDVLAEYFDRYGYGVVVETGLWAGRGSSYQFVGRATVIVCDLQQANCDAAVEAGVSLAVCGDTRDTIAGVLAFVRQPALFWLDAHKVTEGGDDVNDAPLLEELRAIYGWPFARESVVLIDDVRMMGREGWPDVETVVEQCSAWWDVEVRDDVIRCVPCATR